MSLVNLSKVSVAGSEGWEQISFRFRQTDWARRRARGTAKVPPVRGEVIVGRSNALSCAAVNIHFQICAALELRAESS